MSIYIPVSWGELFDKITILTIKNNRITDPGKLKNIRYELELLNELRGKNLVQTESIQSTIDKLQQVNEELWEIEDAIRLCEKNRDFSTRFIELARSVYKTNDRRSELKARINSKLGSKVMEEKSYEQY